MYLLTTQVQEFNFNDVRLPLWAAFTPHNTNCGLSNQVQCVQPLTLKRHWENNTGSIRTWIRKKILCEWQKQLKTKESQWMFGPLKKGKKIHNFTHKTHKVKSWGLSDDLSTSRVFIFFVAKKTICDFGLQQAEFQKRWKLICSVPSAESSRIYWVQRFPPNTEEHMSPPCKNSLSHLTCFSFQCAFSTITNRGLRASGWNCNLFGNEVHKCGQSRTPVSFRGVSQDPGNQTTTCGFPLHPIPDPVAIPARCSAFSQRAETRWTLPSPSLAFSLLSLPRRQISTRSRLTRSLSRYFGFTPVLSVFRITPLGLRGQFNCKGKGEVFFFFF